MTGDIALETMSVTSESAISSPISAAKAADDVIGATAMCRMRIAYNSGKAVRAPENA